MPRLRQSIPALALLLTLGSIVQLDRTAVADEARGAGSQVVAGAQASPGVEPAWLRRVNLYRALAGLRAVAENPAWSEGGRLHARYTVKNDVLAHDEDPANPWYTPEGRAAARNGNVMASSTRSATNSYAVDLWIQGPFHAVGIIDPALRRTGFGSFRDSGPDIQMAATLDVLRGLRDVPANVRFPVKFPSGATPVPLRSFTGGEHPDPLSSCPGYTAPSGLPIILQIGDGSLTPSVTAHSLTLGDEAVDHCIYDETNYTNPDGSAQGLGRAVLDGRDAIVLIPKAPLEAGRTYTVSVSTTGATHRWTFKVAVNAR